MDNKSLTAGRLVVRDVRREPETVSSGHEVSEIIRAPSSSREWRVQGRDGGRGIFGCGESSGRPNPQLARGIPVGGMALVNQIAASNLVPGRTLVRLRIQS